MRKKPDKMDSAFASALDEANFLRTSELFVAREPLNSVSKRTGRKRGDLNGIVALDASLGPQLQSKARIVASFRDSPIKGKKLPRAHQDFLLVEQSFRQTRLPQHCLGRKAQFFEPTRQRT